MPFAYRCSSHGKGENCFACGKDLGNWSTTGAKALACRSHTDVCVECGQHLFSSKEMVQVCADGNCEGARMVQARNCLSCGNGV